MIDKEVYPVTNEYGRPIIDKITLRIIDKEVYPVTDGLGMPIFDIFLGPIVETQPQVISSADYDDSLTEFSIVRGDTVEFQIDNESSFKLPPAINKNKGRWITPEENISVAGVIIEGGYFYFGGQLNTENLGDYYTRSSDPDPSLVNEALPIQPASRTYQDESLDYWPSFFKLSPRSRGAYLNWLASARNDISTPIGYVFIYFYGLERRIFVDGKVDGTKRAGSGAKVSDEEYTDLFQEVIRLSVCYREHKVFQHYACQLIEAMIIIRPHLCSVNNESDYFASGQSLLFKFRLASAVNSGLPISGSLALAWIKYYAEYTLRTPARRCAEEFNLLFEKRYLEIFSSGLFVKPNKTRLELQYFPASGSLRGLNIVTPDLPDPVFLKSPVQKLMQIAEKCTNELEAYSRYLGKKETSRDDIEAVMLLPDDLINLYADTIINKFRHWADKKISQYSGLALVSEFWTCLNKTAAERINKKEAEFMQNVAQRAGYGIAPDLRHHFTKADSDGYIVLFNVESGEVLLPSTEFSSLAVTLQLGVLISKADKLIDTSEQEALNKIIDNNESISLTEKKALHAYLIWLLNSPDSLSGLKVKIESLGMSDKHAISQSIIAIAWADGKIDPSEIKRLEKIYSMLGLNNEAVTSDIHRLSILGNSFSKSILKEPGVKASFSLDAALLSRHESATKDVQSLLSTIFVEDDLIQSDKPSPSAQPVNGLDEAHNILFLRLIEKDRWERNEVAEICKNIGLLLGGAVEVINEWSYEQVDAPVLDDTDEIWIDLEIVEELKG